MCGALMVEGTKTIPDHSPVICLVPLVVQKRRFRKLGRFCRSEPLASRDGVPEDF